MKIAIEAQRIFRKNKHGMDMVILEIIRELQKIDLENEYYIYVACGEDHCLVETENFHIIELATPTYILWEQVALPLAISKLKPDILHCTSNTAPLYTSVPLVLTLHDIIFLEKNKENNKSIYQKMGWYYRRFIVPRILKKCKKIITVSQFECENIRKKISLSPTQLTYIYNGYSEYFKPSENTYEITKKYISEKKYNFFLGNTAPKKNVEGTLKAYKIYLERSSEKIPLLIADMKEKDVMQILKEENLLDIKPYIYSYEYITHQDLPMLYNGAFLFLYTSYRESFGIPILESMACGTPVITSNTSAMPEIAGEMGVLSDPTNPNSIAEKILLLEQDESFYNDQVSYGLERVKLFSWANAAKTLHDIYICINN